MVFVYDFHPGSETLFSKHFAPATDTPNGYSDPFSSGDPNAPRPYSHHKNTLLRTQHSSLLPEGSIWNFIIQLTSALRVIHAAGLAWRALDPTKIILTARSRLRLSCAGVVDVLTFDSSSTNALANIPLYQVSCGIFAERCMLVAHLEKWGNFGFIMGKSGFDFCVLK